MHLYRPCLSTLIVIMVLIQFGIFPCRQSGFYCNDPKISHKYTGDTITMGPLLAIMYLVPLILVCTVEMRACKHSLAETTRRLWFWYKEFLIGIFIVGLITEIVKTVVTEPRPHFLDTCRPDTGINCITGQFIPSYKCTNKNMRTWLVSDSSRSFPSGHTSLSIYSALFCIWYLRHCLLGSKLLKQFVQTILLGLATICALSRITDNRHHWWDVLSGAVLGAVCAVYSVEVSCRNFKLSFLAKVHPSHSTDKK